MTKLTNNSTRIVLMSPDLMKLYDVQIRDNINGYQPVTFVSPRECLELMTTFETETDPLLATEEDPAEQKAQRIEKQWGELELRLSFFTDGCSWQ